MSHILSAARDNVADCYGHALDLQSTLRVQKAGKSREYGDMRHTFSFKLVLLLLFVIFRLLGDGMGLVGGWVFANATRSFSAWVGWIEMLTRVT